MTAEEMKRAHGLKVALSHWVKVVAGRPVAWITDFQIGLEAFEAGDFAAAATKWRPLAEKGLVTVQYLMGVVSDVSGNHAEAVKWFRKAAEDGHAVAQNNPGSMYEDARGGLQQSDTEATKWYREAASQGLPEAQTNLGVMYAEVWKDNVEAYAWLRIAAAQGNTVAERARDIVAARMTTDEICIRAERRAERYWNAYVLPFRNGPARPLGHLNAGCL